jgi:uncharacterized membrane protein YhaH (DUF805 family)
MEDETLITYIQSERKRGVGDDALRSELLTKGWPVSDINTILRDHTPVEKKITEKTSLQDFSLAHIASGRINRTQFLLCLISVPILMAGILGVTLLVLTVADIHIGFEPVLIFFAIATFFIFLYQTSAIARRLHDIGYSGYYALLIYIPGVGTVAAPFLIIYLLIESGTVGVNKFGEPPSEQRPLLNVLLNTTHV